eukprot:21388-Chlamydomonas_euryale.AAC.1
MHAAFVALVAAGVAAACMLPLLHLLQQGCCSSRGCRNMHVVIVAVAAADVAVAAVAFPTLGAGNLLARGV